MRPFDKAKIYFSMSIAQMTASSLEFSKEITTSISRFKRMDWGDTSPEDVLVNDDALKHIDRVLAVYNTSMGNHNHTTAHRILKPSTTIFNGVVAQNCGGKTRSIMFIGM